MVYLLLTVMYHGMEVSLRVSHSCIQVYSVTAKHITFYPDHCSDRHRAQLVGVACAAALKGLLR